MNLKRGLEWKEFNLHVRCSNCSRESGQTVSVPIGEGSPEDLEQLLESSALQNTPYQCRHCESVIGQLFGVSEGESF